MSLRSGLRWSFNKKINLFVFQQPFHCEIEHKIGLTCMTSGPVTCRVRLDRGGYVPGEAISIWATITNNSKVTIKHTRASLTEVMIVKLFRLFTVSTLHNWFNDQKGKKIYFRKTPNFWIQSYQTYVTIYSLSTILVDYQFFTIQHDP